MSNKEVRALVGMADGKCMMCELSIMPPEELAANAFAAGFAISATAKNNPHAVRVCEKHRELLVGHCAAHQVFAQRVDRIPS